MGGLRVLLALAVLFGHTGGIAGSGRPYLITGGPLAVQAFFIISGFYMGLVLTERYNRPELTYAFYKNRAIRIFAIYWFFLALYLAVFVVAQLSSATSPLTPFLADTVSVPEKILAGLLNVIIIGQDLTLHLEIERGRMVWSSNPFAQAGAEVFRFMLIPMAWSLALEIYFYAIAPFIVRRPVWQIAALFGLSLGARIAAAGFGVVEDPFSYRFFPFELALFLAGVLAYKGWAANREMWDRPGGGKRLLALSVPVVLLAYPWLHGDWSDNHFFSPPRIFALALLAVGLPAIHGWTRNSRHDRAIGELSYPLYLVHFLVLGLLSGVGLLQHNTSLRTLAVAVLSLVLAWAVTRTIDLRIEDWRRRIAARAGANS